MAREKREKKDDAKGKSNAPASVLYRLWLKSREMLRAKSENGALATEAEASQAFLQQVLVEQDQPVWEETEETKEDSLTTLWKQWKKEASIRAAYDPDSFLSIPTSKVGGATEELALFHSALGQTAQMLLGERQAQAAGEKARIADAYLQLYVTKDAMAAWLFVFAPWGGRDVTEEQVIELLAREGVVYGYDSKLAQHLVEDKLYFKVLPIACGVPPVDGTAGKLIECIERESSVSVTQREDGTADYKSSGKTRKISPGDVIMRMEPPTEAQPGIDVHGKRVQGTRGEPIHFPKMKNTSISPDGCALLSTIEGHIYFDNNQFVVESLLVIDGNVDGTVGNLKYTGDILVEGDVCEGFEIKTTGSVIVKGMVESAKITAGGSITVEKGINGNSTGTLNAKHDIRSKFLENCTAKAGGDIYAGSIIWSDIFCRGSLYIQSERGVMIGGSAVVLHQIEAVTIGNSSRRPIDIVLGSPPDILSRRDRLEGEMEKVQAELSALLKDLRFLEEKQPEDARRKEQFSQMRLRKPILQMRERHLAEQLEETYQMISNAHRSSLKCVTLYPPARISIGSAMTTVDVTRYNCNIYESQGEIVIGSW